MTTAPFARIVFDIDGTLARSSSAHLDALADAARDLLGVPAEFTMDGEKPHLNGAPVAGWVDAQCFALLVEQAGRVAEPGLAERLLDRYAAGYRDLIDGGAPVGTLIDGAAGALAELSAAGAVLGLSTGNASPIAALKLGRLGLGEFFAFAPDLGFGDRHRDRRAVAAAAVAGLPGHGAVTYLVGDTVSDMTAAAAAGVRGVGVLTGAATADELRAAGAWTVLDDVSALPAAVLAVAG